jgi:hypothetical protein
MAGTHGSGQNPVTTLAGLLDHPASGVTTLLQNTDGYVLWATGTTVPGDVAGYAKGCLFIDTNVATGTTGLNCNKGTSASCVFTAVTQA